MSRVELAPGVAPSLEKILRALIDDDAAFEALEKLARGLRSRVSVLAHEGRRYAVKRYDYPLLYAARTLGIRSRARREFETLSLIAPFVKVPVVPVAWGERRSLGLAFRSIVATELLEGATDLKQFRISWEKSGRDPAERAKLVAALPELARLVRRLHDAGIFLATPFEKNVLWRKDAPASEAFAFIDLPFARKLDAPLAWQRAGYDLACLDKGARPVLRASERLRLYLAYRGRTKLDEGDRELLGRVERDRTRREHGTWLRWRLRLLKKRVKRTSAGKLMTGRDPERRDGVS